MPTYSVGNQTTMYAGGRWEVFWAQNFPPDIDVKLDPQRRVSQFYHLPASSSFRGLPRNTISKYNSQFGRNWRTSPYPTHAVEPFCHLAGRTAEGAGESDLDNKCSESDSDANRTSFGGYDDLGSPYLQVAR